MEKKSISAVEHRGFVETIATEKGYGLIRSKNNDETYFFYLSAFPNPILNDVVRFFPFHCNGKATARSIRKCYKNEFGIEFVERVNTHHIHLDLDYYLPLIFNQIQNTKQEFIVREFEFPNIVGNSSCLSTSPDDTIVYAQRKGRKGYTRFVKNRESEPCFHITAAFKKIESAYLLITIYIGKKAGPEPWDEFATQEDVHFWKNHALIYDPNNIIIGSETKNCPWWRAEG